MNGAPHKVLLIDDDVLLLASLARRLKRQGGFECLVACSAAQGMDLARQERPDLILLDLNMPEMSGFGFLRELKKDPSIANIPVLILSGILNDEEILREALALGALGYFDKTDPVTDLMSTLKEYCG